MVKLNKNKFFFFNQENSLIDIYPTSIEHAYIAIVQRDLETAKAVFSRLDSPRARWGKKFVSMLQGYMEDFPTYFEIRNFLEIDLEFLIKNELIDYVEQFLGALEYLSSVNIETYKFVGRVMYENNIMSMALKYMEKSKEIYYKDPELHFMFSKYYLNKKDYSQALLYINNCLELLPDYYPALVMKEKIEQLSV